MAPWVLEGQWVRALEDQWAQVALVVPWVPVVRWAKLLLVDRVVQVAPVVLAVQLYQVVLMDPLVQAAPRVLLKAAPALSPVAPHLEVR
jgi:hypothetical protein